MEIFKLFGTIAINGEDEVNRVLDSIATKTATLAKQVADKLDLKIDADTNKAESELEKLTTTIVAQERVLESLKKDYASVSLEQGKNSSSAKALAKQIKNVSGDLKDNKTKLDNVTSSANKFDKTLDELNTSARATATGGFTILKGAMANLLSQGFTKLIQAGTNLISGAWNYQSTLEGYNTSFTVMTGSAEEAAKMTEKLAKIAAETPFEMTTLADTTQLLMNYGLSADDAIDKMTMLGDISQGNSEKMGRIAMAYGQMSSAGKVSLEDVKQMIEAGFNPLQEISETTGESMASLYKRISKGTISVDEITESMKRSTSEGGKYFGSMEMQSKTLAGQLSTLKDTINSSLGTALSGAMNRLASEILPKITAAIEKIDWEAVGEKISIIADKIIDFGLWVFDNFDLITQLVVAFGAAFLAWKVASAVSAAVTAFKNLSAAITAGNTVMKALNMTFGLSPIGLVITAIAALVAIFIVLWNKCEGFRNFWKNLWEGIKNVASKAWEGIKNIFSGIGQWFTEKFNAAKQGVQNIWSGITNFFGNIKSGIVNAFSNVKEKLTAPFTKARDTIKGIANKIKGFFSGEVKLPKIKLPHFKISPAGWEFGDLLEGKIPRLSIDWYAKAMKDGMILDDATIFGMNSSGQLLGAGEAGSETVVGTESLLSMINGAVQAETGALAGRMDRIIELLVKFFPQILAAGGSSNNGARELLDALTNSIDKKLGDNYRKTARGIV